jgi:hypothetical protein
MRFALTLGSPSFLFLAGCTIARPAIGYGLHGPIRKVQADFDRRVRTQLPAGSDAVVLHAEFVRQKFMIVRDKDAPLSFAAYRSGGLGRVEDWNVRWPVYAGRIADIHGN